MLQIKLCYFGLTESERKMLNGVVLISKRRAPTLILLEDYDYNDADIIIIDGKNTEAMQWAAANRYFAQKTVLWIDTTPPSTHHLGMQRPVQWAQLPIILARQVATGGSTTALNNSKPTAATPFSQVSQSNALAAQGLTGSQTAQLGSTADNIAQKPENGLNPAPAGNAAQPAYTAKLVTMQPPTLVQPKKPHILVVDDSQVVRDHLTAILQQQGYDVTTVQNGSDALGSFDADKYQAVLMDVLMPEMDGYEACKRLKASVKGRANVPVIMLTSKSSPFDRIRGKMAGCNAYLTKPVALTDLVNVLDTHIK